MNRSSPERQTNGDALGLIEAEGNICVLTFKLTHHPGFGQLD